MSDPKVQTVANTRSVRASNELTGIFPALFTPLKDDDPKRLRNGIDYEKAKRIIDDLVKAGVDGIVPVGSTGQSPTVSHRQHLEFVQFTAEYLEGRLPIVAGAGSNCTRESIDMISELQQKLGSIAVLCVTGYYNNPPQQGLSEHYRTLSRETGAKIVVYNVPGRTASYLEPETLIELAQDPNIIGLKQAVDFRSPGKHREDTIRVVRETRDAGFAVLSGEDDALPEMLEIGGTGIISGAANIPEMAGLYRLMCAAFRDGNMVAVAEAQAKVLPVVKAVFCRKNPIPLGTFFNSPLYLPLVSVKETADGAEAHAAIMKLIETTVPSLLQYHR